MADKIRAAEITEKLGFGMLLALAGGFMDAYSYTVRGKVFATGQTGNFVLAAAHLAERDYSGMLHAIVPIVSFWAGIFTALHILNIYFKEKELLWKRGIILISILILFITGLIPATFPDIAANTLIAFAASLQYCAFRKFGTDGSYASIFCTGNMRSCAENYYKGIVQKDKKCLKKAYQYNLILVSFFTGAVSGALEAGIFHEKAIWSACFVLSSALMLSFVYKADVLENTVLTRKTIKEQV